MARYIDTLRSYGIPIRSGILLAVEYKPKLGVAAGCPVSAPKLNSVFPFHVRKGALLRT